MQTLIFIILQSLTWAVGNFIGAYTVLPIFTILFFGIPYTFELKKSDKIVSYAPISKYLISLIILSLAFAVVTFLFIIFTKQYVWGYFIGLLIVCLFGLGKCGNNENNKEDYFRTNNKYLAKYNN